MLVDLPGIIHGCSRYTFGRPQHQSGAHKGAAPIWCRSPPLFQLNIPYPSSSSPLHPVELGVIYNGAPITSSSPYNGRFQLYNYIIMCNCLIHHLHVTPNRKHPVTPRTNSRLTLVERTIFCFLPTGGVFSGGTSLAWKNTCCFS